MAWLFKRDGSNNWWLGYRFNGRQYRSSTETPDKAEAERQLAKVRAMYEARKAGSLTEDVYRVLSGTQNRGLDSLRATVDVWLAECKTNVAPKTLERYRDIANDFCTFLNAGDTKPLLKDVQKDNVADYLRHKKAQTSPQTARLARIILGGFFNYAVDNEKISASPVPSSKSLKLTQRAAEETATRRPLTLAELETVFEKCPNDFWQYMVLSGFYLGQRMGDLICLTWGAVDFKGQVVRLVQSKTGKSVRLRLFPRLMQFLIKQKKAAGKVSAATPIWPDKAELYRKQGSKVFSNEFYDDVLLPCGLVPSRTHKKSKKSDDDKRKVNAVSFHSLRHTFVTLLKATGATQAVAKELAGHSSDSISDHYTTMPPEILDNAILQLPDIQPKAAK
jgi:integrase